MSFCDPQIEGKPKYANIIEIPPTCNSLFSKNKKLNSFVSITIRIFLHEEKRFILENRWFYVLRNKPHSPKVLESATKTVVSSYSNWLYLQTTGLISSIKVLIGSLAPVGKDSLEEPLIFILSLIFGGPIYPGDCI